MPDSWQLYNFDAAEKTWFDILRAAIPNTVQGARSRGTVTDTTPRFNVVQTTQPNYEQRFILNPGENNAEFQPLTTWFYQLVVVVSTNRETNGSQHAEIEAKAREALQFYKLARSWSNPVFTISNHREQPEVKAYDQENNIDSTTLTFTGMLSIRTGAFREYIQQV